MVDEVLPIIFRLSSFKRNLFKTDKSVVFIPEKFGAEDFTMEARHELIEQSWLM